MLCTQIWAVNASVTRSQWVPQKQSLIAIRGSRPDNPGTWEHASSYGGGTNLGHVSARAFWQTGWDPPCDAPGHISCIKRSPKCTCSVIDGPMGRRRVEACEASPHMHVTTVYWLYMGKYIYIINEFRSEFGPKWLNATKMKLTTILINYKT